MSTLDKWAQVAGMKLQVFLIMKDYETDLEQDAKEKFQSDLVFKEAELLDSARVLFKGGSEVTMHIMRESYGTLASSNCRVGRISAMFENIESIHALHLTTPQLLQVFNLNPVYWTAAITMY